MVLGAASAMSRPAVRTEKKKASVIPSIRPGDAVRAAPWAVSAMPRAIRNRRGTRPSKAKVSPGSPHQEQVENPVTGKRALGPWLGPFSTHPDSTAHPSGSPTDALLPQTIYMDAGGAAHMGLAVADHLKLVRALQQAQEEAGMLNTRGPMDAANAAAAAKLAGQLLALRRDQAKHVREVGLRAHATLQKAPAVRDVVRRTRKLNQPRKMN